MNKKDKKTEAAELREKAEQIVKNLLQASTPIQTWMSETDALKLIHELQVHHIELELQNEELMLAKERADSAMEVSSELYDFSPSGYLTLSKEGIIMALNLFSSRMLGKERTYLLNCLFGSFVTDDTRNLFYLFFEKVFKSKTHESCEIMLKNKSGNPILCFLTGIALPDRTCCQINLVDITSLKKQ
jgi:PAS domain-containing protein